MCMCHAVKYYINISFYYCYNISTYIYKEQMFFTFCIFEDENGIEIDWKCLKCRRAHATE